MIYFQYWTFFRFAVMTADEMASDEMKAQREKFTKQVYDICIFFEAYTIFRYSFFFLKHCYALQRFHFFGWKYSKFAIKRDGIAQIQYPHTV